MPAARLNFAERNLRTRCLGELGDSLAPSVFSSRRVSWNSLTLTKAMPAVKELSLSICAMMIESAANTAAKAPSASVTTPNSHSTAGVSGASMAVGFLAIV